VRDGARIGEVENAERPRLMRHVDRDREELVENRHAVGDVDDALVVGDFGDEGARVLVLVAERHADAEREQHCDSF
jgi:hypothetical protein